MLVYKLIDHSLAGADLTFGASGNPLDAEEQIGDSKCVIEVNRLIIDVDDGGFHRLNRQETIELAKFLLSCASVMEDE